jgi:hypothetical protein
MVKSKFRFLTRLGFCLAAIACVAGATPLRAETIAFQFQTTIDARPVGGSANAPFVVTYAFDSNLTNQAVDDPIHGDYAPLVMTIQVGDEIATASGPGTEIFLWNNTPDGTDGYDVRIDNFTGSSVDGTLFGMEISFCRFLIVDIEGTMFNSNSLPLSPAFATQADFQQSEIDLIDPLTGGMVTLEITEFAATPQKDLTPFSLSLSYDPMFELIVEVVDLQLPEALQHSLLQKLHAAISSITNPTPNDAAAAGQLLAFISQVDAQSGNALTPQEADTLAAAAEDIILLLTP